MNLYASVGLSKDIVITGMIHFLCPMETNCLSKKCCVKLRLMVTWCMWHHLLFVHIYETLQRTQRKGFRSYNRQQTNFSPHIAEKVKKANRIMGLIRTFTFLDQTIFTNVFKALVRQMNGEESEVKNHKLYCLYRGLVRVGSQRESTSKKGQGGTKNRRQADRVRQVVQLLDAQHNQVMINVTTLIIL